MTCSTILLLVLLQWCNNIESVTVKVEEGWLMGEYKPTSTKLTNYYSFKGIPYAKAPLGDLRFRAPQPHPKWQGIRNATKHGSICTQPATYTNFKTIGSEDCLFLNVYSPDIKPDCPLPVIFFIHGGTYVVGSGNTDQFGPDFLMSYGVVLVTVNYRLGAFGFLAVETGEIPGNAGMKDNIAALQWVQKNIKNFGGDPERVTIIGQASGSSMVSLHVVAPSTKNLFKRAVMMSGSFINDWSIEFEPRRRAFALGRVLGLDTNDPYELTRFLQSIPAQNIIQARPNFLLSDDISNIQYITTYFTPIVEKKFGNGEGQYLTTSPFELMCNRQTNQVDIMMGHTESEGLKVTAEFEDQFFDYYPYYKELLVPLKITLYRSPNKVLQLADRIQKYYFQNQIISRKVILDVVRYNSYFVFVVDIHSYIEKLLKVPNTRRYFYNFALYSSRNVYAQLPARLYGVKNATHRDDIPYLFTGSFYNQTVSVDSKVFTYIQLMCKLYTNFVKYGNPTPDNSLGLIWPEYDSKRVYVNIGRNGTLTTGVTSLTTGDLGFWGDLYSSTKMNIY